MKKVAVWALPALLVAAGGMALAQPGPGWGGNRPPRSVGGSPSAPQPPPPPRDPMFLVDALDLSDEQTDALFAILDRYHTGELRQVDRVLHRARRELEGLVHDPGADEQQVLDAARAVSAQAESLALLRHRMAVEIDGLLTEEQRERFRQLRESQDRGGRGGPPSGR